MKFTLKQKQFIDTAFGLPLLYINKLFAMLFGVLLKRNHTIEVAPQKIIILKMLGWGSVVLAADSLVSIKKKYPTSSFEIICSKAIAEGIASLKLFDKIHIINDTSYIGILKSSAQVLWQCWFTKSWVIDLEVYSKLSSLLSLWTLAINRFGFYFKEVGFRKNINTHNVLFDEQVTVTENYERMAHALGVHTNETYIIKGFEQRNTAKNYSYIAINNTCSELAQERLLQEIQLVELCQWIVSNTQYKVALVGAPSDKSNMQRIIEIYKLERVENYCGKYTIEKYYQFLFDECKAVITVDSAPLHIAIKLNVPTLSIWGPSSPQSRIQNSDTNKVIYHAVNCSPCVHKPGELPCRGNNFCIKDITTQEIVNCLQSLL